MHIPLHKHSLTQTAETLTHVHLINTHSYIFIHIHTAMLEFVSFPSVPLYDFNLVFFLQVSRGLVGG